MTDTPEVDTAARDIAENVLAAYARQANERIHPAIEQTLLARLVETLGSRIHGPVEDLIEATNAVLDSVELTAPELRGPRVAAMNVIDQTVTVQLR